MEENQQLMKLMITNKLKKLIYINKSLAYIYFFYIINLYEKV